MRITRYAVTCALGLFLTARSAGSTPIPVTIEGSAEGNFCRFDVAGEDFHYRISTAEGPLIVGLCGGSPCSVVQEYSGGVNSVQFGMTAVVNGVTSGLTSGTIRLSFDVVPGPEQRFTATLPIAIVGDIIAYGEFPHPPLFAFTFQGSGPGTVHGLVFEQGGSVIQGASFTVPGTAEMVPEPGAAVLLATGLLGIVRLRRRA